MANKTYELMHKHIMETAAGLFSTIPFSKLTVKQICEAANINRNTFYRHFDDKFDLLEVMLTEAFQHLFQHVNIDHFKEYPFETLTALEFAGPLATLDFQFSDPQFQDIFNSLIFKIVTRMASDPSSLWKLGNMYIIRLWNHNQEKPYTLAEGYQIFDQMYREKKFPGENNWK